MLNEKTNEFIENLIKLVNESELPPVNVRLALDSVRAQVVELEKQAIENEKAEAAKQENQPG